MKLATWNINSVRLRAPMVVDFLNQYQPDILCLQETKTPDQQFPFKPFEEAGYTNIHIHGMKGYNGVAVISKLPFTAQNIHHRVGKQDCRHIEACFHIGGKDIALHNLYIPAGGDEPDPAINEKFKHKLDFVEEMTTFFKEHHSKNDNVIAVGDFNIAPYEQDVWSHKQLLKVVSHTPPETERLAAMLDSLDWVDTARHFVPFEEKLYSWWSYRSKDWTKNNRGRRLDHIWATQPLKPHLKTHECPSEIRSWERPSDHVPVIVEFDL